MKNSKTICDTMQTKMYNGISLCEGCGSLYIKAPDNSLLFY